MNRNKAIDKEAAARHIAAELKFAAQIPDDGARIEEIDRITDRAARLGLCRARTDVDSRFVSQRAKRAKPHIPGILDIGYL